MGGQGGKVLSYETKRMMFDPAWAMRHTPGTPR